MVFSLYMVFFIIIPVIVLKFMMNFNHLLVSLLSLEFVSLSFFIGLGLSMNIFNMDSVYLLYFLVMVVCEGVLGLCLLVLMSYNYGGDQLFSFNKISC